MITMISILGSTTQIQVTRISIEVFSDVGTVCAVAGLSH